MLGICGTGMGSLAGLLHAKGFHVTGSDKNVYPPMSTQLEEMGIKPFEGYSAENLKNRPDLAVIGNVITKDNPEAKEIIKEDIDYLSMPEALAKFFLKDKKSIVVAGTHGKTTTANLVAWLLEYAEKQPGFLIGGVGLNFMKSYRFGSGEFFVTEGDEYDTAFFDKGPKFLHYKPDFAIIGTIEFDHADIYRDLEHIKDSFKSFVSKIPSKGIIVTNGDSKTNIEILKKAKCKVVTYGFGNNAEYRIKDFNPETGDFKIAKDKDEASFSTPLIGRHNLLNACAAITLLLELGIDYNVLIGGLAQFRGVKRRQEIRGIENDITVLDDFAHHPTAIKGTIEAVKERFPDTNVWAIFEPRSNTTRRNTFQDLLPDALKGADKVIIAGLFNPEAIPEEERLKPEKVIHEINSSGTEAFYIQKTGEIISKVAKEVLRGDVILIMSNGAFDNIHERILEKLRKKQ